jgi:hypothetical protein
VIAASEDSRDPRLWADAADEPARRPAAELEQRAERPVFVLGYYSSGTSLLLNLLDGHPELLAVPTESRHFTSSAPRDLQALHAHWIRNTISPYGVPPRWLLGTPSDERDPYDHFGRCFASHARERSGRDLLAAVAQPLAVTTHSAARLWVEKTPTNEFHVDAIITAYPGARFVHSVRDPRSTIGSIRNYDSEAPIVDLLTGAAEFAPRSASHSPRSEGSATATRSSTTRTSSLTPLQRCAASPRASASRTTTRSSLRPRSGGPPPRTPARGSAACRARCTRCR